MKTIHFKERVQKIVKQIPKGKVMSYGDVALASGYPGAARAVGTLMAHNHDSSVPCHRVVRSDGTIGEYNGGGPDAKARRLTREGVSVRNFRVPPSALLRNPQGSSRTVRHKRSQP